MASQQVPEIQGGEARRGGESGESLALLLLALESAGSAAFALDLESGRMSWPGRAHTLIGVDRTEQIATLEGFLERVIEEDREPVRRRLLGTEADGGVLDVEFRVHHAEKRTRWLHMRGRGAAVYGRRSVLGLLTDATERRAAEEASARLAAIVTSSQDAIVSKDLRGVVTSWNKGAEQLFGYTADEIIGRNITTLIPPERLHEERTIMGKIAAGQCVEPYETERMRKDGALVPVALAVSPMIDGLGRVIGASKVARDITERRLVDQRLRQAVDNALSELEKSNHARRLAERMVALGTMAAGLGHDIGNLLVPLRAHTEAVAARHADNPVTMEDTAAVLRCADYFASLVRGLRMCGRDDLGDGRPTTDLAAWIGDAEPLLRSLVPRRMRLVLPDPSSDLPAAAIAPGGLTQAMVNLVKNSVDAIGPADGTVEVRMRRAEEGVWIEVRDNGPGMSPEVAQRCMEPYFTTRVRGASTGTGLGLTIVHRAVEEAGGKIEIDTELGRGTSIAMWLPIRESGPQPERTADVRIADRRLHRLVQSVLVTEGYAPRIVEGPPEPGASVWIVDHLEEVDLENGNAPPVILLSDAPAVTRAATVLHLTSTPKAAELRACLRAAQGE